MRQISAQSHFCSHLFALVCIRFVRLLPNKFRRQFTVRLRTGSEPPKTCVVVRMDEKLTSVSAT